MRFTARGSVIYAILMAWPEREASIKALGKNSKNAPARISNVSLLGSDARLKWRQDPDALVVEMPGEKPCNFAYALKITT
jgi:alpha-L-fucosidase